MFSCIFCKAFKKILFTEQVQVTASRELSIFLYLFRLLILIHFFDFKTLIIIISITEGSSEILQVLSFNYFEEILEHFSVPSSHLTFARIFGPFDCLLSTWCNFSSKFLTISLISGLHNSFCEGCLISV